MKHTPGRLVFNITDVCNLNCHNCSSFNNYAIKGHRRWKDNKKNCQQWSEKVDPTMIFILGGEPMLNPDFLQWMHGLANFFPDSEVRINTNGTVFHLWPTLYDELLPYNGRVNISISGHNSTTREQQIEYIKSVLRPPIKEIVSGENLFQNWIWKKIYSNVRDPLLPDVANIEEYQNLPIDIKNEIEQIHQINIHDYLVPPEPVEDYVVYVDKNNIRLSYSRWDEFIIKAVKFDTKTQTMTLYNSDPEKAVSICHGGHCAQIKEGKFYKCEAMANLPTMIDQKFPFDISQEDKNLIYSYQPATVDWGYEQFEKFLDDLNNQVAIPQCKFCPESRSKTKLFATNKKIKVIKISD